MNVKILVNMKRFIQPKKFSFVWRRILRIHDHEDPNLLIQDKYAYDRFLRATLIEFGLSLVLLVAAICFMLLILDFNKAHVHKIQNNQESNGLYELIHKFLRSENLASKQRFKTNSYEYFDSLRPVEVYFKNLSHFLLEFNVDKSCIYFSNSYKPPRMSCFWFIKVSIDPIFLEVIDEQNLISSFKMLDSILLDAPLMSLKKIKINFFYYCMRSKVMFQFEQAFEFNAEGLIASKRSFQVIAKKNIKYLDIDLNFILILIFLLIGIYFLTEELIEIGVYKLAYFDYFLNVLDLLVVLSVSCLNMTHIYLSISFYQLYETFESNFSLTKSIFLVFKDKLNVLIELSQIELNLSGVLVLLIWLKLTKFMNFTVGLTQMNATLSHCFGSLLCYLLILVVVLLSYSLLFCRLFGSNNDEFSTIFRSQFSLLKELLADSSFKKIHDQNPKTSQFAFFSFYLFVFVIFMDIFLAIIAQAYSHILSTYDNKPELDYYMLLSQHFQGWFTFYKRFLKLDQLEQQENEMPLNVLNVTDLKFGLSHLKTPIGASYFRTLLKGVDIDNNEIDAIFYMHNIREKIPVEKNLIKKPAMKRRNTAVIYGDLNDNNESILTLEVCQDILDKLIMSHKRISLLKKSYFNRKTSFVRPVWYHRDVDNLNDRPSLIDQLSILSDINSLKKNASAASSRLNVPDMSLTNVNNLPESRDLFMGKHLNEEIHLKDFDNVYSDLMSWKDLSKLNKDLKHVHVDLTQTANSLLIELANLHLLCE